MGVPRCACFVTVSERSWHLQQGSHQASVDLCYCRHPGSRTRLGRGLSTHPILGPCTIAC
jgi:hypothetical protein